MLLLIIHKKKTDDVHKYLEDYKSNKEKCQ